MGFAKICDQCGTEFTAITRLGRYCGHTCSAKHWQNRNMLPSLGAENGISKQNVGALNELRVSIDLLQRGYHVFRALSPACPCDLIAFAPDGKALMIEVKTAYARGDKVYVPGAQKLANHRFDILALALPDRLIYQPDLSEA
jgi:hypothetical protein